MQISIIAGAIALSVALVSLGASSEGASDHPTGLQFAAESFGNRGVEARPDTNGSAQKRAESVGYSAGVYGGCSPKYLTDQQELLRERSYNIGSGCARVGDGSDPDYQQTQKKLLTEPGYSIGSGTTRTPR
jgi:hypothetical protein